MPESSETERLFYKDFFAGSDVKACGKAVGAVVRYFHTVDIEYSLVSGHGRIGGDG